MKPILWRTLLILALLMAGFLGGALAGALWLVPRGAGLTGGAMVLGYGVLGAGAGVVIGAIAAFRLGETNLRRAALGISVPVLGVFVYLSASAYQRGRQPEADFAPAGMFTASMQRLDTSDPVLFVKIAVNSRTRTWTQTGPAPEYAIYYAAMKPRTLIDIRTALDAVAGIGAAELAECAAATGPAIKRLRWDIADARGGNARGTLDLSQACLNGNATLARALFLLEKASSDPAGKVRRE